MRRSLTLSASLTVLLSGCDPIIPAETIHVTETLSFTYAQVIAAAAIIAVTYYVVDPLAPNWEIKETKLDDTRYRIDMKKKRVTTGGDGESLELFHRQADKITTEMRAHGYQIVTWTEGVESEFPIAHRWSRGVIELKPAPVKVGAK